MQKYKSFLLLEKRNELAFLLHEGSIIYAKEFKDRIFFLRGNKVADLLLRIEDNWIEDDNLIYNFIKPTEKEDIVTFIPQVKLNSIDSKFHMENPTGKKLPGEVGYNYTYYVDPMDISGRNEIKIGRLVRGLQSLTSEEPISDQEIEKFINLYKSESSEKDEEFSLVCGDDISMWYNESSYYENYGSGPLAKSCMRDVPADYFEIYTDSESCQLLILTRNFDGNKRLIGRALVWKLASKERFSKQSDRYSLVETPPQEYFMDRIYCLRESDENKFKKYALEHDWMYRELNNSQRKDSFKFNTKDGRYKGKIQVAVHGAYADNFPFMDTLEFINESCTMISNIGYHNGYVMAGEEGECDPCDDCEGTGYKECTTCSGTLITTCSNCNGEGYEDCNRCDGTGYEECRNCHGSGHMECPDCDGSGDEECRKCSGSGEIDGHECEDCEGLGTIDCSTCDGEKKVDCDDCDGQGEQECRDCNGSKKETCEECGGSGEVDCDDCDGRSNLCPECTGLIKLL